MGLWAEPHTSFWYSAINLAQSVQHLCMAIFKLWTPIAIHEYDQVWRAMYPSHTLLVTI
jgi:hypothetical protein